MHPRDGADVDPFPLLGAATRLLFPLPAKTTAVVTLGLRGQPLSAGAGVLEVAVSAVRVWPGGRWTAIEPRPVELVVPDGAELDPTVAAQVQSPTRRTLGARGAGALALTVFTVPAQPTADVVAGRPGALTVERAHAG